MIVCQINKGLIILAVPSCQLDYIWNELQSRIGRLTCDPDLEAGRNNNICDLTCVMAIPDCQLNYIWNELQSRIGGHTCDPDLEPGRHRFLTWILAWRS